MNKPYDERGYVFPVPAFNETAAERFRSCCPAYRASVADRLTTLPAKDQYAVFSETHLFLHWVYEMISQPVALSRGQAMDESQAVGMILKPGQMSLHQIGVAHGSKANICAKPRIGIAVRSAPANDDNLMPKDFIVRGYDQSGPKA
jgi:hypothetical protein